MPPARFKPIVDSLIQTLVLMLYCISTVQFSVGICKVGITVSGVGGFEIVEKCYGYVGKRE